MKRAEKIETVESLNRAFTDNPHVLLATFRGLTVNQVNSLRAGVRAIGGEYKVIKNRLAKRAAAGTPVEGLSERFSGPCAIVTHESDPIALAKSVAEFVKDNPQVELLAGLVDAKDAIDAEGVTQLSKMPGLPELRAQLLALINTPATTLVRLIATPGTQVARVIDAKAQKGDGDGGGE